MLRHGFLLLLCMWSYSCQATSFPEHAPGIVGWERLERVTLTRLAEERSGGALLAFDKGPHFGPEEYTHLFLSEDGTEVIARYLGPGGPTRIRSGNRMRAVDGWSLMERWMPGAEMTTVVVAWHHAEDGSVSEVWMRKEPFYTWRVQPEVPHPDPPSASKAGEVLEWRPYRDGEGIGPWREL